jgi:hypothetical protein
MENPDPSPQGQQRQINLQAMANQFMAGLQRHFDMLAFNLACRETVAEDAYNRHVHAPGLMPVTQLHQNYEQMQAHARDLMLRQVINDSLNLVVACLHNTHLFLALVKLRKEVGELNAENQKPAQEAQNAFARASLNDKFEILEKEFGIISELEDSLTSLAFCMQALAQNQGVVQEDHLDEEQLLQVELKRAADGRSGSPVFDPTAVATHTKVFNQGEKVNFTNTELQELILMIAVFAHQLFQSVADYAREHQ